MEIIEFVRHVLIDNGFKETHVDSLLESNSFLNADGINLGSVSKPTQRKERLFSICLTNSVEFIGLLGKDIVLMPKYR
jgi:hypothetical protein